MLARLRRPSSHRCRFRTGARRLNRQRLGHYVDPDLVASYTVTAVDLPRAEGMTIYLVRLAQGRESTTQRRAVIE